MTATTIPETEMTGTHSSEETRAMLFVENTFVASKVDQDLAVVRSAPGEDRTIAEKDLSHSLNEAQTAALNAGGRMEAHTLDLLILLSRRKRIILQTTLSAALLAAIGSALLPNRYAATANILPPQQSQSLAASMIGQLGSFGAMGALAQKDLGLKNPNDLYVGMLRSRTSEDALIRRFDLLRVYHDTKMSDARRDLEDASSIILAKEGFVSISVEDRDRHRAPQIDLANAEQALKETEQKTGVIQLDGQAKAIIEAVARLRASVAAKEVQLHAMRLFSTEQNPDVELREQELSGLRAELSQLEKRSGVADDAQVSAGNVPAGNVPEAGLLYVRKLRDVKYAETIFELLARQYEAAKLDEAKTAAVIQVLDPAIEPDRKSSPQRAWIVAVASLLGFLGSVGYVFLAEAFARMRTNPDVGDRFRLLKSSFQSGL